MALRTAILAFVVLAGCGLRPAPPTPATLPSAPPSGTASPIAVRDTLRPLVSVAPKVTTAPTIGPSKPPPPPTPTATPQHPLPLGLSEIPSGGVTVELAARSRPGTMQLGVPRLFRLGHCGLRSPLDFDGSLWDPKYGHNGHGAPIRGDAVWALINEVPVTMILLEKDVAEMRTRVGLVVTLWRHHGPRLYSGCS